MACVNWAVASAIRLGLVSVASEKINAPWTAQNVESASMAHACALLVLEARIAVSSRRVPSCVQAIAMGMGAASSASASATLDGKDMAARRAILSRVPRIVSIKAFVTQISAVAFVIPVSPATTAGLFLNALRDVPSTVCANMGSASARRAGQAMIVPPASVVQ